MYDQQEINQRLVIIKHAGLDDVRILDSNYRILSRNSSSPEEQKQYEVLQTITRSRMEELTQNEDV